MKKKVVLKFERPQHIMCHNEGVWDYLDSFSGSIRFHVQREEGFLSSSIVDALLDSFKLSFGH